MNLLFGYEGRIGRGAWWLARLVVLAIIAAVFVLAYTLEDENGNLQSDFAGPVVGFVALAALPIIFWINVVTTIKRYHDRGKVGYWVLLIFVPYVGALWQLVECGFFVGDDRDNEYGPAPSARKVPSITPEITPVVDTIVAPKQRPFEYDLRPTIKTGRIREYSPTSPRKP